VSPQTQLSSPPSPDLPTNPPPAEGSPPTPPSPPHAIVPAPVSAPSPPHAIVPAPVSVPSQAGPVHALLNVAVAAASQVYRWCRIRTSELKDLEKVTRRVVRSTELGTYGSETVYVDISRRNGAVQTFRVRRSRRIRGLITAG